MKPMYFTDIEALHKFIENNWEDFYDEFDKHLDVDRMFESFHNELRSTNSGMYHLDYERE